MPSAPANQALRPDRYAVYINNGSREEALYRVQSVNPSFRGNLQKDEELGNFDPVGSSKDPIIPRVVIEQHIVNLATELLLGGKAADATSVTLGDLVQLNAGTYYQPIKSQAGTVFAERQVQNIALAEIAWRFQAQGVSTRTISLQGTQFITVTSGMHTWPTGDSSSPGSIRGKDIILYMGATQVAADTIFRLQTLDIRATVPIQEVREMGNYNLVGAIALAPTVSIDMEILESDLEPENILTSGTYDFNKTGALDALVRIFDPTSPHGALGSVGAGGSPLVSIKLDQLDVSDADVSRSQVRNLASKRFTFLVTKANTPGTAGLVLYKGDPA